MSGAVIIAQLIGHDRAQATDIVARGRSPVFALCRALLAAGANPNSKLECFGVSVLALTVKTIGIGAKLTIKEDRFKNAEGAPVLQAGSLQRLLCICHSIACTIAALAYGVVR